ncbi:MAG: hypothetical protein Q9162_007792 [Coniocarpon cinnabarinum]
MQYSTIALFGLAATAFAAPAAEPEAEPAGDLLGLPIPQLIGGSSVKCSSGNVYCSNGSKTQCKLSKPGQTCTSGEVICCNSAASLLALNLLNICGSPINVSIPVNVLSNDSL